MRIALVGTVESTRATLETLLELDCPPVALFTLDPARSARHSNYLRLAPVARSLGVPAFEIRNVNAPEVLERLREVAPDYAFVIGWSQICGAEFLALPERGCIGYHPAPLPENRGRAVIAWTLLQRRQETGGSLFWMDEGMDSGDILAQRRFAVARDETAATLCEKHRSRLREMLREVVPLLRSGERPAVPQDHARATYCARRTAEDGFIDWRQPAEEVWTLVRAAGRPYPGAFTSVEQRKLTVWSADLLGTGPYWGLPGQVQRLDPGAAIVQCGDRQHVLLKAVQVEGEAEQPADEVLKIHQKLGPER